MDFDPTTSADAGGIVPQGRLRKQLRVQPTSFTGTLAEFPVGILIGPDADLQRSVRADASDIYFTSVGGLLLDREIETYDTATGTLTAWVRLPTLPGGSTTTVYLNYGGDVWAGDGAPTWQGFASVWHLAASSDGARDSANGHDGSMQGIPVTIKGIAGPCVSFDGVDDTIEIPRPVGGELDFAIEPFAVSLWVRATANRMAYDTVWWKGGSSSAFHGYTLELGTGDWNGALNDGAFFTGDFGLAANLTGSWHHLAMVVDRSVPELRLYTDGALADTVPGAGLGSIASTEPATIGSNFRSGNHFEGQLDEVRIHTIVRSSDWIAAEHENLTNPQFLAVGPEEGSP